MTKHERVIEELKAEVRRLEQLARETAPCPVHAMQRHGLEAEELRRGVERIIDEHDSCSSPEVMADRLGRLLDEVDARDSLAFIERKERSAFTAEDAARLLSKPDFRAAFNDLVLRHG